MALADIDAQTVTLRYFASVREGIGVGTEDLAIPPDIATVGDLLGWLRARDEAYAAALSESLRIRVAVDHIHADPGTSIRNASEIALFPMMTGG